MSRPPSDLDASVAPIEDVSATGKSLGVVIVGSRGRLGRLIVDEVLRRAGVVVVGAVDRTSFATDDGAIVVDRELAAVLGRCRHRPVVVIDAATAGATAAHVAACRDAGVPYVCATTGLSLADRQAVAEAATTIPVLVAANLSPGAHLVAHLATQVARAMPAADAEIVEIHHRKKKDAPSGTALMLADAVAAGRREPARRVLSREGEALRAPGDIGVVAVRGGDVVGEHTVTFFVDGERVELSHRVSDRRIFATGAIDAALFVASRAAGAYGMGDVLAERLSSSSSSPAW
jgi:4-hydroxy-tetrahydrodipicolinate reductase